MAEAYISMVWRRGLLNDLYLSYTAGLQWPISVVCVYMYLAATESYSDTDGVEATATTVHLFH